MVTVSSYKPEDILDVEFMNFMYNHRNVDFQYFINSIPIDTIFKCEKDWVYPNHVARHPKLRISHVLDHPNYGWDWDLLSLTYPADIIVANLDLQWNFYYLQFNPTLTLSLYEKALEIVPLDLKQHFHFQPLKMCPRESIRL